MRGLVRKLRMAAGRWGRRWGRWVDGACFAALLVVAVPRAAPLVQAATGVGGEARELGAWEVVTLAGDTLTSAELEGSVVVVTFWATWCPHCEREMPSLQRIWDARAGQDVTVVGLSIDSGPDGSILGFVGDRGFTFPVARATREVKRVLGGISGVPTTFVIDREGRVRHRLVGAFTGAALERAVRRIAEEPPGA